MDMNYGFIRASNLNEATDAQRNAITELAERTQHHIEGWVIDCSPLDPNPKPRDFARLLAPLAEGDTLVCAALENLGNSMEAVAALLAFCNGKGVTVHAVAGGFHIESGPFADSFGRVLSFSIALSAHLDAQRRAEAEAAAQGRIPIPSSSHGPRTGFRHPKQSLKLYPKEAQIRALLQQRVPIYRIAEQFGVSPNTVRSYIRRYIYTPE